MSKKPFVPFDKFERECVPENKSLHQTMQENCKDRLAPPEEKCPNPCVPYWQRTGGRRCLDIGVVEVEESDGCCDTRWVRIPESVVWTDTGNTRCDEPNNRIQKEQVNQCGGTQWVTTAELCCTPNWVNIPETIDCSQSMERVQQEDGCGHTRWRSSGNPVNWVSTGEVRCEPGDFYQVEQINQCGTTRWLTVAGGCPCIPDWQPLGPQRCTGDFIENQESDGCGHTRWQPTGTAVVWSDTGETRCNGGFIQNQQISQCGTTRWFTTATPCTTSPNPNDLGLQDVGGPQIDNWFLIELSASTGVLRLQKENGAEYPVAWVTGAFDRNAYEVRITATFPDPSTLEHPAAADHFGSTLGQWYDLGETTVVNHTWKYQKPPDGMGYEYWENIQVFVDIRKKNEAISGGASYGPIRIRT